MAEKIETKKVKISIPWPAIVIAVIVVVLGLFLLVLPGKGLPQCSTEGCFDHEFSMCQPSEWKTSDDSSGVAIEYKIVRKAGSRCVVSFHTNSSTVTNNVWITCNFDNSVSFPNAQSEVLNSPKGSDCRKGQ